MISTYDEPHSVIWWLGDETHLYIEIGKAIANFEQDNRAMEAPPKMKIFQSVQRNLATIGVSPKLSHQPYPFNTKIITNFLILESFVISNLAFEIFEAKTLTELTQSIYICSLGCLNTYVLSEIIVNVKKLFKLINDCENIVNTSEY